MILLLVAYAMIGERMRVEEAQRHMAEQQELDDQKTWADWLNEV